MLEIRSATKDDLKSIMNIYKTAQDYMIASGNPTQWGRTYPTRELIQSDINKGVCFLICEADIVHGVFALFEGVEPTYEYIDGAWLNDDSYVTIHRLAGDGKVHGIFQSVIEYCKQCCSNIRVDTHNDNKTMQSLIEKHGFMKCGTIYVRDGSPRIAYQKLCTDNL
ncbi:MAG: N-acetyltransferase [Lachnospiraceae bacterium]|nr:N-acetyltransferase [Lachnospiraceae bacterium]